MCGRVERRGKGGLEVLHSLL
eukprot:SAG11_NODE_2926_length_2833_cov_2.590344_1_plen_20_part_10